RVAARPGGDGVAAAEGRGDHWPGRPVARAGVVRHGPPQSPVADVCAGGMALAGTELRGRAAAAQEPRSPGRDAGRRPLGGGGEKAGEALARRVVELMRLAGLPTRLSDCGVSSGIFPVLAEEASQQWTAQFNPRPVTEADLLRLYQEAL